MNLAPVLLIAFNRPDRLERLIESIRPHEPTVVRISIDGPRSNVPSDSDLVAQTRSIASRITWTSDIKIHSHSENLGITRAIPWAISWVLSEFDEAIILEDDISVGPDCLEFMTEALAWWKSDPQVFAISGYNLVPRDHLQHPNLSVRYSKLAHSYAWATWSRAWSAYDPDMNWFRQQSVNRLRKSLGSIFFALRWKQFSTHVRKRRVSTWDYQWVTSIWAGGGKTVIPTSNLIDYHGLTGGTHTERSRSWSELPIERMKFSSEDAQVAELDERADAFVQRKGHRATPIGVLTGILEGPLISVIRWLRSRRGS